MNKKILVSLLLGSVLFLSACNNEDDGTTPNLIDLDDATAEAVTDFLNDDVDNIVMDNIDQLSSITGASSDSQRFNPFSDRAGCAAKTHDEEAQQITIDFGEGCIGNDGIERSGKLIISYTDRRRVSGAIITTTFEDFFVNGNKIDGIRELTNISGDSNMERSFNIVVTNGKITFEDGSERSFESNRTRTWAREATSREVSLSVTGSSSGTTRNGDTFSMEIETPVVFTNSCRQVGVRVAVEGVRTLTFGGETRSINYGNGTCDNLVTLTRADGSIEEIEIENRRRRKG